MAKQMITYADSLSMVRRALSKTQNQIGVDLGLPQNAVSQLESRSDLLLSTLRRYVNALGADLDLVVRLRNGSRIVLEGLGDVPKIPSRRPSLKGRPAARHAQKGKALST